MVYNEALQWDLKFGEGRHMGQRNARGRRGTSEECLLSPILDVLGKVVTYLRCTRGLCCQVSAAGRACVEGASLGSWAAAGHVWGALMELGERVAGTGLCGSGLCHRSNAVWGARTSCVSQGPGQSHNHGAAEFPLLLEEMGRDAVCWSSGGGCTRALHACIPAKWTLAAAFGKAETRFLHLPFLTSLCSLQRKSFTSLKLLLKHNRYLLLFKPLNTWNRAGVFLCSETCLVGLMGERECSTALRAFIRQAEGRSSMKGTGCLTKSEGLFLSCDLGSDYSLL